MCSYWFNSLDIKIEIKKISVRQVITPSKYLEPDFAPHLVIKIHYKQFYSFLGWF